MPQTIEAISHAKAAGAPLIVAVNKMDKPDADPTRVVNELLQHEVVVESLGGETQLIEISALKKTGLDNLIEAILLQAEVLDLRANPDRSAEGVIIEAKLDRGRGPGRHRPGGARHAEARRHHRGGRGLGPGPRPGERAWRAGAASLAVRTRGDPGPWTKRRRPATPSPWWRTRPAPGSSPTTACVSAGRPRPADRAPPQSLADMMARLQNKQVRELPLVIKADVQGSAEAITGSLEKLGNEEVRARIINSGAGAITESDVLLARASSSPIIGFNVRASKQARDLAEREGVEIRYYAIIYDLIDDIRGVLSGMLAPIQRETWLGNAQVLEVFNITKVGNVAGCRVNDGVVRRGARIRVIRDDVVIQEMGTLQTLRRFKDDVAEVISGQECGMNYANQDIKPGDVIECFTVEAVARTL